MTRFIAKQPICASFWLLQRTLLHLLQHLQNVGINGVVFENEYLYTILLKVHIQIIRIIRKQRIKKNHLRR